VDRVRRVPVRRRNCLHRTPHRHPLAQKITSPVPVWLQSSAAGRRIFVTNCVRCQRSRGHGRRRLRGRDGDIFAAVRDGDVGGHGGGIRERLSETDRNPVNYLREGRPKNQEGRTGTGTTERKPERRQSRFVVVRSVPRRPRPVARKGSARRLPGSTFRSSPVFPLFAVPRWVLRSSLILVLRSDFGPSFFVLKGAGDA